MFKMLVGDSGSLIPVSFLFSTYQVANPIWCPIHLESPSGKFDSPLPDFGGSFNFLHGQGMMYEAAEVRRCLKGGEYFCSFSRYICQVLVNSVFFLNTFSSLIVYIFFYSIDV